MLICLLMIGALVGEQQAPGEEATFRLEKKLVRIGARAVDAGGQPLMKLEAKDFRIVENENKIEADHVGQEELPLDLALVLDVSHSMKPSLRLLADSAKEALKSLRKGDRVAVFTFAGRSQLDLALTEDFEAVDQMLERIARGNSRSATVIYAAVHKAAQYLGQQGEKERRRAVLVVSDAKGMRGKSEQETLAALWEADASVHLLLTAEPKSIKAVRYTQQAISPASFFMLANLPKLVEGSGGETLPLVAGEATFAKMLARIRAQYSVFFTPSEGAALRKVIVQLSPEAIAKYPGAKSFGRKEYRMPDVR